MRVFPLSSGTSGTWGDAKRAMLLSTCPLAREGDLQGLENPGLLVVGAGEACDAVGAVEGIGQQTEAVQRVQCVPERDAVRLVFGGPTWRRQAPLHLPAEFQRQQTHKHMAAGPGVLADKDGAYLQQARLQR